MPRGGRKPTLSRDRIIEAVAALLEDEDADAITTRTVGEALHVHPTALYRYFRDMDSLLREAADHILRDLVPESVQPDPVHPDASTALDNVEELCLRLRATLMTYPGAARVMAPGPSRKLNERRFTERMLALLSGAGLPDDQVVLAYHALVEYIVGSSAIDSNARDQTLDEAHRNWRTEYLNSPPTRFPHTVRLAHSLYPSQDTQFRFGLTLIMESLRERAGDTVPTSP
jgi:TetR/AcrR family transcriptional regulator, tetracycline repressor protein